MIGNLKVWKCKPSTRGLDCKIKKIWTKIDWKENQSRISMKNAVWDRLSKKGREKEGAQSSFYQNPGWLALYFSDWDGANVVRPLASSHRFRILIPKMLVCNSSPYDTIPLRCNTGDDLQFSGNQRTWEAMSPFATNDRWFVTSGSVCQYKRSFAVDCKPGQGDKISRKSCLRWTL